MMSAVTSAPVQARTRMLAGGGRLAYERSASKSWHVVKFPVWPSSSTRNVAPLSGPGGGVRGTTDTAHASNVRPCSNRIETNSDVLPVPLATLPPATSAAVDEIGHSDHPSTSGSPQTRMIWGGGSAGKPCPRRTSIAVPEPDGPPVTSSTAKPDKAASARAMTPTSALRI